MCTIAADTHLVAPEEPWQYIPLLTHLLNPLYSTRALYEVYACEVSECINLHTILECTVATVEFGIRLFEQGNPKAAQQSERPHL